MADRRDCQGRNGEGEEGAKDANNRPPGSEDGGGAQGEHPEQEDEEEGGVQVQQQQQNTQQGFQQPVQDPQQNHTHQDLQQPYQGTRGLSIRELLNSSPSVSSNDSTAEQVIPTATAKAGPSGKLVSDYDSTTQQLNPTPNAQPLPCASPAALSIARFLLPKHDPHNGTEHEFCALAPVNWDVDRQNVQHTLGGIERALGLTPAAQSIPTINPALRRGPNQEPQPPSHHAAPAHGSIRNLGPRRYPSQAPSAEPFNPYNVSSLRPAYQIVAPYTHANPPRIVNEINRGSTLWSQPLELEHGFAYHIGGPNSHTSNAVNYGVSDHGPHGQQHLQPLQQQHPHHPQPPSARLGFPYALPNQQARPNGHARIPLAASPQHGPPARQQPRARFTSTNQLSLTGTTLGGPWNTDGEGAQEGLSTDVPPFPSTPPPSSTPRPSTPLLSDSFSPFTSLPSNSQEWSPAQPSPSQSPFTLSSLARPRSTLPDQPPLDTLSRLKQERFNKKAEVAKQRRAEREKDKSMSSDKSPAGPTGTTGAASRAIGDSAGVSARPIPATQTPGAVPFGVLLPTGIGGPPGGPYHPIPPIAPVAEVKRGMDVAPAHAPPSKKRQPDRPGFMHRNIEDRPGFIHHNIEHRPAGFNWDTSMPAKPNQRAKAPKKASTGQPAMAPAPAALAYHLPLPPAPPRSPPEQLDTDDNRLQEIVSEYDQYKWTINHFSVVFAPRYLDLEDGDVKDNPIDIDMIDSLAEKKGRCIIDSHTEEKHPCHTAQDFVVKLISLYSVPSKWLWISHVTPGFINNGDITSLIVVNNGYKPHSGTTSSTSFGFHQFNADEITWWTVDPGMSRLIMSLTSEGRIVHRGEWSINMKPSEKRFHRAYWLAVNDRSLGGLLNRACDDEREALRKQLKDAGALWEESALDDEESRKQMVINGDEEGYEPENGGIEVSEDEAKLAWMEVEAEVGIAPMDV